MEVRNRVDISVLEGNPGLLTSKPDKASCGIGLRLIRQMSGGATECWKFLKMVGISLCEPRSLTADHSYRILTIHAKIRKKRWFSFMLILSNQQEGE